MMKSSLIAFLLMSMTFAQDLREWQSHLAGLKGLEVLSPFLGSIPQNKPASVSNLEILNFLNNGLVATNPGLDLLNHGLGFGMAALRGLGIIMENNRQNHDVAQQ
uniref:Secreted protein n=1 Tax=Loa loa TaxID=7209 RepID=A0A1I7VU99_LOALO